AGETNRIMEVKDIAKFKKGQVLVTTMTDPDWEPIMKIASAIVTDSGGRTCHAAIISRELGIPCVVGTGNGSSTLKSGKKVTVDCAEGDEGYVFEGILPFKINKTDINNMKRPKTKVMMNIGSPDIAFATSFIPNDGVGLAREEFIINNTIKIHPLALLNYEKITDKKVKKQIDEITAGYKDKKQFFIDKLAEGVATIAAAYHPKDVIIRLSDFKSNEYANLIGGTPYEPVEANPMIGWRGASRYYDPKYEPAFALECKALAKVRNEMGLTNLKVMVPFCRTVVEGKKVLEIMAKHGLPQGKNGLEVYVMAEIPTNIILAEEFAKVFDGFSIGSNDLTQLCLGIDRDSGILNIAGAANEKSESVKDLIRYLIAVGKKTKTKVGICGQAPSDFPDFAEFLVELGIDSISLNPDTVIKTTLAITEKENKLSKKK
ncbi:MAG: Phosphoenolpyruvate synthase, partial [Candidatus Falkowbacteria bacterium GW2011_GWF2_39_8]